MGIRKEMRSGLVWGLVLAGAIFMATAGATPALRPGGARQIRLHFYAPQSTNLLGQCLINHVRTEHRRLGFFRVKLLPLTVLDGVRLEFNREALPSDVLTRMRSGLQPLTGATSVEARDLQVSFLGESQPRLRSERLRQRGEMGQAAWILEGVVLQTAQGERRVSRAEIVPRSGDWPQITWRDQAGSYTWDLSSDQITIGKPKGKIK
jgi:hypothetical protein